MLLTPDSIEQRVVIAIVTLLPYLATLLLAGSWRRWPIDLVSSLRSLVLFVLVLVALVLLLSDYRLLAEGVISFPRMIEKSLGITLLVFYGLPIVIACTSLMAVSKSSLPLQFLFLGPTLIGHFLYLLNIAVVTFQLEGSNVR